MIDFKDKKIIGITVMLGVVLIMSILTYGKNKNKVFKYEYMSNILIYGEGNDTVSNSIENYENMMKQ